MASSTPWPLMPPKSTELRMEHFDSHVYSAAPSTILYKFLDAMCGDGGAGNLKKETFLQRLSASMDGIYGTGLDYIFGGIGFLSRTTSESYPEYTEADQLTSEQWDAVAVKDAAYRKRISDFFAAATKGGTAEAIRLAVHAATSADCQVIENWVYVDNFDLSQDLGRAAITCYAAVNLLNGDRKYFTGETAADALAAAQTFVDQRPLVGNRTVWAVEQSRPRNEVTVVPHKAEYSPREIRNLREMLDRITPQDTVVTINPQGLAVNTPVTLRAACADSTYFQVEKIVTATPELDAMPAPELLAADLGLNPSERWLFKKSRELAPYAKFNITSEYSYYYLLGGGDRSPVDSVTYGTLQADGTVKPEQPMEWYDDVEAYGPWTAYEITTNPIYKTQAEYVAVRKAEVISLGGQADDYQYRLPVQSQTSFKRTYTADLAVAVTAPTRESTVTSSWTSRKPPRTARGELRAPASFVRS